MCFCLVESDYTITFRYCLLYPTLSNRLFKYCSRIWVFFRVYWPRAHRRYVSGEMCSSRAHSRGRRSGAARPRSWEGYIREHAFGRRPPPEFGARGRAAPAVRLQNKSGRTLPDQILYARINSEGRRPTEFGTRGVDGPCRQPSKRRGGRPLPSACKTRGWTAPAVSLQKINS